MALSSPGVEVSVIDESQYLAAAPSTTPLIFVTSAANKENASGTGTAPGTTAANAGKLWLITSQRDLTDTFGTPLFYTDSGSNPVHGGELNEYGLQAAYSYLGVSSRAYIARADIDTSQLVAQSDAPTGNPVDGTYWVDTSNTSFGIFEWSASASTFTLKTPLVINNDNYATATVSGAGVVPKPSFGSNGNYAIVITSDNANILWYKNTSGNWIEVGSSGTQAFTSSATFASTTWQTSWPVVTSTAASPNLTSYNGNTLLINGQTVTLSGTTVTALATNINAALRTHGVGSRVNAGGFLEIYADATAASDGSTVDGKVKIEAGTGLAIMLTTAGLTAGTAMGPTLFQGPHYKYPDFTGRPAGSIYIKTTSPNSGADWFVKKYSESTGAFALQSTSIYSDNQTAINSINATGDIPTGQVYIKQNATMGTGSATTSSSSPQLVNFKIYRRNAVGATKITSVATTATASTTATFTLYEGLATSTGGVADFSTGYTITLHAGNTVDDVIQYVNAALPVTSNMAAAASTYDADGNATSLTLQHSTGGEILLKDGTATPLGSFLGFSTSVTKNLYVKDTYDSRDISFYASNWKGLVYESKAQFPTTDPADGTLWYSSVVDEVDILAHDGSTWVGYLNAYPDTDPAGPQVASIAPTTQSTGDPLVDNDLWVSTADIDRYGLDVYVRMDGKWNLQDTTDQTTPDGWLFADARWGTAGTSSDMSAVADLLSSDYLDPDAPDPALYPKGMKLWNLRRSGFNVKKYIVNHININANDGLNARYINERMDGSNSTTAYISDRWVTVSPNQPTGSGSFGRFAQRGFIVAALKAVIDTNQRIRDTDTVVFNLIATPGYPEAIQNMIAFNVDRGLTAFVVGDTPFRLTPTGTALSEWGNNTALAFDNGEQGGVSYNEYMAMFYPSGYTNDNHGNYVVVPPSHMMLRTIATSDQKSFQWFAPAGTRRGVIDNATAVGYIEGGEFKTTSLPQSLRDVLASVKINPLATIPGAGIVNYGQYTRASSTTALDRINVARLVCYLRRQLALLVKPFLFEPNDAITRAEVKQATESFLLELIGQRALYDYLVVCDESNNTPTRIDRSELWLDIAVEPVKAVEFIYIPLRIKNTGDIKAGL
jgi:hypothetical protein